MWNGVLICWFNSDVTDMTDINFYVILYVFDTRSTGCYA